MKINVQVLTLNSINESNVCIGTVVCVCVCGKGGGLTQSSHNDHRRHYHHQHHHRHGISRAPLSSLL